MVMSYVRVFYNVNVCLSRYWFTKFLYSKRKLVFWPLIEFSHPDCLVISSSKSESPTEYHFAKRKPVASLEQHYYSMELFPEILAYRTCRVLLEKKAKTNTMCVHCWQDSIAFMNV